MTSTAVGAPGDLAPIGEEAEAEVGEERPDVDTGTGCDRLYSGRLRSPDITLKWRITSLTDDVIASVLSRDEVSAGPQVHCGCDGASIASILMLSTTQQMSETMSPWK